MPSPLLSGRAVGQKRRKKEKKREKEKKLFEAATTSTASQIFHHFSLLKILCSRLIDRPLIRPAFGGRMLFSDRFYRRSKAAKSWRGEIRKRRRRPFVAIRAKRRARCPILTLCRPTDHCLAASASFLAYRLTSVRIAALFHHPWWFNSDEEAGERRKNTCKTLFH